MEKKCQRRLGGEGAPGEEPQMCLARAAGSLQDAVGVGDMEFQEAALKAYRKVSLLQASD